MIVQLKELMKIKQKEIMKNGKKKKKEITPLPIHPAMPTFPPDIKPLQENQNTHESITEINPPNIHEINIDISKESDYDYEPYEYK